MLIDVKNMKEQTLELAEEYRLYKIVYTPTTFVIDRLGRAVFIHVGFAEGQEKMLEKEIRLLLERT